LGIGIGLHIVDRVLGIVNADNSVGLSFLYGLAVFIPHMAVFARRLHDTGRSGWWWLTVLIPFLGVLVLFLYLLEDSQPGDNQYGPNPKSPVPVQPVNRHIRTDSAPNPNAAPPAGTAVAEVAKVTPR
jgi:uncharacterized membrane protein YhaH (DUF805 family)